MTVGVLGAAAVVVCVTRRDVHGFAGNDGVQRPVQQGRIPIPGAGVSAPAAARSTVIRQRGAQIQQVGAAGEPTILTVSEAAGGESDDPGPPQGAATRAVQLCPVPTPFSLENTYLARSFASGRSAEDEADREQHSGVDGGGDAAEDQLVATGVPAWSDARNSAASITSTARRAQHLPTQHVVRLCHGLRLLGAHGHHGAAQ